jgi:REP element-mobilizing transposase RayT
MPLPNRRTVRLPHFDYGGHGSYFITVCTYNRQEIFGDVRNGIICLNHLGALVWQQYRQSFSMRPHFTDEAFIVMPNHWHALIGITRPWPDEPMPETSRNEAFARPVPDTLTSMVRGLLAAVTSRAKTLGFTERLWQGRFWDHVVRDEKEYVLIKEYILNNTRRWCDDRFHPNP